MSEYLGDSISFAGSGYMLGESVIPLEERATAKKEVTRAAATMQASNPGASGLDLSGLLVGGTYSPDLSEVSNQQNVYHQPYENYQPVVSDSRVYDITYPNYTTIIDSPDAEVTTTKKDTLTNTTDQTPLYYQPSSYEPSSSQDESSGIDPTLLIGGALVLGLLVLGGGALAYKARS